MNVSFASVSRKTQAINSFAMHQALLTLLLQTVLISAWSQTMISFQNAQPYDESRYADISGQVYFFKDFTPGTIIDSKAVHYDPVAMNYNGYTHSFEVRQGDRFISLDPAFYQSVLFPFNEGKDTITFVKGVHPAFRNTFVQEVYRSEQLILVKQFIVGLTESQKNIPGGILEVKRFSPRQEWYLIKTSSQTRLKLDNNRRQLLKALGQEKALSTYLKQHKEIDLDTDAGMKMLIKEWERLAF